MEKRDREDDLEGPVAKRRRSSPVRSEGDGWIGSGSPTETEIPTVPNSPHPSFHRPSNPEAPFSRIPLEVRARIFSFAVDPEDLEATLNAAAPWIRTSRALQQTAAYMLNPAVIEQVAAARDIRSGLFAGFDYEHPDSDYGTVLLAALEIDTAAAPLWDGAKRRMLVRDAMRYGRGQNEDADHQDVYHVIYNLAANLDNFIDEDRVKIVNRACYVYNEYQNYGRIIERLIEKAAYLQPAERLTLVNTVWQSVMGIGQANLLAAWAPKMHLIPAVDQAAIWDRVQTNPGDPSALLERFAEHAGSMCPSVQGGIISSILIMEPQERLRSNMLCHLARQFGSFDSSLHSQIIDAVIGNVEHAKTEEFDPAVDRWSSEPKFCAREALFHLQEFRSPLEPGDRVVVDAAIDTVLTTSGPAGRIQFLSRMTADERLIAVPQACDRAFEHGEFEPMMALGSRMRTLSKEEKDRFVETLVKLPINDRRISETIEHIVRDHLKHLNPEQRTSIVRRQLDIAAASDISKPPSGLVEIRRNAGLLHLCDVQATMDTAREIFSRSADIVPESVDAEISLRSCHREAVRCLLSWAGHAVSRPLNERTRTTAAVR